MLFVDFAERQAILLAMKTRTRKTTRTNRTMEKPLSEVQEGILRFWGWKEGSSGWEHKNWTDSKDSKFGDLRVQDILPSLSGWFHQFEKLQTPKGCALFVELSSIWAGFSGRKYGAIWPFDDSGSVIRISSPACDTPEEAMTRLYHAAILAGCIVKTDTPAAVKAVRRSKSSRKISKVKKKR